MSFSWRNRKAQLGILLKSHGDEGEDALALDHLLHARNVTGQTSKTKEIESLRFKDRDLLVVGTLEHGQFGVIDVVTCHLDGRTYVRKSIEKRFVLRNRHQCSPQYERDILLRAKKDNSCWAPHLLCAFQMPTHLNLVMDYAEGGTLWDVLESSPGNGKIPESDLRWWAPQIASAIDWCHSQGFAHRDIKPHNFVITANAHILLIDFGSAAPLLPPGSDGSQMIEKRYCLVLCGTCDYISPEILRTHEEALVALEMEDEGGGAVPGGEGYGLETDWWSFGAMLYEMAYGVAPFFANDIRQTYLKITNHKKSLRFNKTTSISPDFQDLLFRLLTDHENRLGRQSVKEIAEHPFFSGIDWKALHDRPVPPELHLPRFSNNDVQATAQADAQAQFEESNSQPFAFSAFFQSSQATSPGLSALQHTPSRGPEGDLGSSFIGFSWGPTLDAFPDTEGQPQQAPRDMLVTPRPTRTSSSQFTPKPFIIPLGSDVNSAPGLNRNQFTTPIRGTASTPHQTRTSTSRRTTSRRPLSDRQALKQLVDCVGMSARKKVLESGRKPRILTSFNRSGTLKELRFPSSSTTDNAVSSEHSSAAVPVPESSESEETDMDGPPSPSPRPGSALSVMSRRSGTPTITASQSQRVVLAADPHSNAIRTNPPTATLAATTSEMRLSDGAEFRGVGLDELEERHTLLMQDILDIEQRLGQVSMLIRGGG